MIVRLRKVVVAQHRRLLTVIDRAEASLDDATLRRVGKSVVAHLDAQKKLLFPLVARADEGARYGEEQHHVLRFALDRLLAAPTFRDRATRLRVLRDLFVHHMERTEWVTLEQLAPAPKTAKTQARRKRG